jgi:sulfur-oxidizing protein SoxZ
MKIRATLKAGVTEVRVLMLHPMETGRRKNDLGDIIPAHFIQVVTATLNGKTVMEAQWGTGISKNPYLTFRLRNAKPGDTVGVQWVDSKGETNAIETVIAAG